MKAQRAVGMLLALSHRAVGGLQGRSVGAGCQWEWGSEQTRPREKDTVEKMLGLL